MRSRLMSLVAPMAIVLMLAPAPVAAAEDFALQIGLPIAGNTRAAKSALLVVRPGGCADPGSARITATADGIVDGARRRVPVTLTALPTPGVYAVPKDWAAGGVWALTLTGTCAGKTAGAIVPVEHNGTFRREAVTQLAHRPTADDIDTALKVLMTGERK